MTEPKSFNSILEENKSEIQRINDYKNAKVSATPRNLAFAGMALVGLLLLSMFVLQIITGVIALVVVVAAGVGGLFGLRWLKAMDPVIKQKLKNQQIKAMMQEARENAVQQLENQVILNAERLAKARKSRDKIGGQIQALESKVDPAKKGTPVYETKMAMISKFKATYQLICDNLDKAAVSNAKFEEKVIEHKDLHKFTQTASIIEESLGDMNGNTVESMLTLEAFDHLAEEFSTALVSVENTARDMAISNEEV